MNAIALTEFNPSLAVINGTIKTTSLKLAEHFEKQHKSVLRSIKNLDCSQEFHQRNFAPMQIDVEIGNGAVRKDTAFEITRDGFTFLAMGFTGKEAAKWKEAYINAFNAMADKLQKPFGLKSLPPSPHISESEASQFKKSIEALCGGNRKKYSELYRIVYDYYEITRYKNIPAGKLEESAKLIGMKLLPFGKLKIPAEPFTLSFTPEELEDLVAERIKSVAGELVEKSVIPTDTIAVSLNGGTRFMSLIFNGKNDNATQDYLVKVAQDFISVQALNDNEQVKSQEQFMTALLEDDYIVMKKAELLGRLQA